MPLEQKYRTEQSNEDISNNTVFEQFSSFIGLLQTWARLYDRYDYWPEACKQWAVHAPSSEIFQQALPLLDKVFLYTNEKEESVYANLQRNRQVFSNIAEISIHTNDDGRILLIGERASEQIGLSIGQQIQPSLLEPLDSLLRAAQSQSPYFNLTEIRGKDGVQRLCGVRLSEDEHHNKTKLIFTLHSIILPETVEIYLKQKLHLTDAEVDIVRRSLRRQDLEEIAKSRSNTLNTIRTHVHKLTKKFGCRSYTDVITRTHELIAYNDTYKSFSRDFFPDTTPATHKTTTSIRVSPKGGQLEYTRYGAENGRPLILLHSLEYGFIPPQDFVEAAQHRGYVVYALLRPGFGKSTPAHTLHDSAKILNQFIEQLNLREVTLVAFSTSAPAALHVSEISERISQTVLVNYALDASDKLSKIQPYWLKGLLDMALKSKHSFKFALRMTNRMYRRAGYKKFYKQFYKNCEQDLQFLQDNPSDLKYAGEILFSANEESVRLDLLSSFDPSFPINWRGHRKSWLICIQGQNTHKVPTEPAETAAEKLGFPFYVIDQAGRNCAFQKPNEFFEIIDQQQDNAMTA